MKRALGSLHPKLFEIEKVRHINCLHTLCPERENELACQYAYRRLRVVSVLYLFLAIAHCKQRTLKVVIITDLEQKQKSA